MKRSQSRFLLPIILLAGCATTDTALERPTENKPPAQTAQGQDSPTAIPDAPAPAPAPTPTPATTDTGMIHIELVDPDGVGVWSRVEIHDAPAQPALTVEVPRGRLEVKAPVGSYVAYIQAYELGAPFTVDVRPIEVVKDKTTILAALLVEGRTGGMPTLKDFDPDKDLATSSAEVAAGTDPTSPYQVPGRKTLYYEPQRLSNSAGWYKGDLMVNSTYGRGTESVAELVARAEKAGLDFLAITDLNTMAAMDDPAFKSDSVVLIPAQAWGTQEMGIGLIYAPGTVPAPPSSLDAAQSVCGLVQSQDGVFAVAHPCFSHAPWQWGLSFVNAIQVWCGEWRAQPPLEFNQLNPKLRELDMETRQPKQALGLAVKSSEATAHHEWNPGMARELGGTERDIEHLRHSANMQAEYFYDIELNRGLFAAVIGGSDAASPRTPLGRPMTYVYAEEKSLAGIVKGLELGRTVITSGADGPELLFRAAFLGPDNRIDPSKPLIGVGGSVPFDTNVMFQAQAKNAKGLKLEILRDGRPAFVKKIETDEILYQWPEQIAYRGSYRARIISAPDKLRDGYGVHQVHAMTSPIFARDIYINAPATAVQPSTSE